MVSTSTTLDDTLTQSDFHLSAADPYVFRLTREARDVRTVSPVRVYADLLRGRGRTAEAAEYLRETAIGF